MSQQHRIPPARHVARGRPDIPKPWARLSGIEIHDKPKRECPDCRRQVFTALRTPANISVYGHDSFGFCVNTECNWNAPDSMEGKLWNLHFPEPGLICAQCRKRTLAIDSVTDTHVMLECQQRRIQAVRRSEGGDFGKSIIIAVNGDVKDGILRRCGKVYQRALASLTDEEITLVHAVAALGDRPKPDIPESAFKPEVHKPLKTGTSQQTNGYNGRQPAGDEPRDISGDSSRQNHGDEAGSKPVPANFRPGDSRHRHYEARGKVLEALETVCASGQGLWWELSDLTGDGDIDYVSHTEGEVGLAQAKSVVSTTGMTAAAVRAVLQRNVKAGNVFKTVDRMEGLDGNRMHGYKLSAKGRHWLKRWKGSRRTRNRS